MNIVAASGNTMGLSVDYPANYKNVLSISSVSAGTKTSTGIFPLRDSPFP
ncbi:S8 family serine peptidase [Sutcliffiella horikoshii]